jgi:hypothetical protein
MPLYHLQVVRDRRKVDPEAVELPDDETAKRRAKRLAAALTTMSRGFGVRLLEDCHVDVTDAKGRWVGRCDVDKLRFGSTPGRSRTQQKLRA